MEKLNDGGDEVEGARVEDIWVTRDTAGGSFSGPIGLGGEAGFEPNDKAMRRQAVTSAVRCDGGV